MSTEEQKQTYRITGNNIRLSGKIHRIGRKIDLNAEDAERLKEFLEPLGEELGEDTGEIDALLKRISSLNVQLEDLFRKNDENVGLVRERDKTIAELNDKIRSGDQAIIELTDYLAARDKTITELNSQIATLKTALAKKEGGKK